MGLFTINSPKKFKLAADNLQNIQPGNEMYYNLNYSDEKDYTVLVKAGDEVKGFQAIGELKDQDTKIFSTVSGKVQKILMSPDNYGKRVPTIIIENDKQYLMTEKNPAKIINFKFFLDTLKKYGLADTEGNMIYTKYESIKPDDKLHIIINAADWDKNSLAAFYFINEKNTEIIEAVNIMKKIFSNASIYFVLNKFDGYDYSKIKAIDSNFTFKFVSRSYNRQMNNQLIKDTIGSLDNNVIVESLKNLINIYESMTLNEPTTFEIVSITSPNMETKNYKIRIGTKISDILESLNIKENDIDKIVRNGILTGQAIVSDDVPVIQGTDSLAFIKETKEIKERICIRCGECLAVCPENLNPIKLVEYLKRDDLESFRTYGGEKCAECGLCSYACPSKINLANKIVMGKSL